MDTQRESVEASARASGLELVEIVEERASEHEADGFSWERRPVLLALAERAGTFDVLLVSTYEALTSDEVLLVALARRFLRAGVEIVSVVDEEAGARLRAQVASIGELERVLLRERLSAGKAKARKEGRRVDGRAPYGYRTTGGTLTVHEEEAGIVERIFAAAAEGVGSAEIARALARDGIATPKGGKAWSRQAVGLVLRNDVYCERGLVSRRVFQKAQAFLDERRRS